jgi:hypothetical protein
MIAESWPRLSVTVEFWPGPGRRIRNGQTKRTYTLRTDAHIVLLSQPLTVAASGEAGVCKMVTELREIFGETPLPNELRWEALDEFAEAADSRNLEFAVTGELPKGTSVTYRLAEITALLEKHRAWRQQDAAAA